MNCDWVKANIALYVYDELADDARYELEQHISRCEGCAAELQAMGECKMALSALPPAEPSPNLLAASRLRLQEALAVTSQRQGWRWAFDPVAWLRQIRFAPAVAAMIFIVGFAAGIMASYRMALGNKPETAVAPAATPALAAPAEAAIAGIRGIVQEAGNKVDIKYDTLVPQNVQGSLDDPRIQQLLLFAARNNTNAGLRMDSVNLLTQKVNDHRNREALVYALRYDTNPGVRLKALQSLGAYVKGDLRVRNAVLEALMNDPNLGVRTEAIQLVNAVRADASVRQVLEQLARQDQNSYIRSTARAVLASTPQID
jgi:hypothetical protein